MSKYNLKFLMCQSFPFNSARARSALLTRGDDCAYHLMSMVKFSVTNEGTPFWEKLVNQLRVSPEMSLFSCPPIVSMWDCKEISPWFAVARMLIAGEIWTANGFTPPVSNNYPGLSELYITVNPVHELDIPLYEPESSDDHDDHDDEF